MKGAFSVSPSAGAVLHRIRVPIALNIHHHVKVVQYRQSPTVFRPVLVLGVPLANPDTMKPQMKVGIVEATCPVVPTVGIANGTFPRILPAYRSVFLVSNPSPTIF